MVATEGDVAALGLAVAFKTVDGAGHALRRGDGSWLVAVADVTSPAGLARLKNSLYNARARFGRQAAHHPSHASLGQVKLGTPQAVLWVAFALTYVGLGGTVSVAVQRQTLKYRWRGGGGGGSSDDDDDDDDARVLPTVKLKIVLPRPAVAAACAALAAAPLPYPVPPPPPAATRARAVTAEGTKDPTALPTAEVGRAAATAPEGADRDEGGDRLRLLAVYTNALHGRVKRLLRAAAAGGGSSVAELESEFATGAANVARGVVALFADESSAAERAALAPRRPVVLSAPPAPPVLSAPPAPFQPVMSTPPAPPRPVLPVSAPPLLLPLRILSSKGLLAFRTRPAMGAGKTPAVIGKPPPPPSLLQTATAAATSTTTTTSSAATAAATRAAAAATRAAAPAAVEPTATAPQAGTNSFGRVSFLKRPFARSTHVSVAPDKRARLFRTRPLFIRRRRV